ncbi:MAG: hypothetical protein EOO89_21555 [Pedobacter sp.]|nr:MAG: hypothetical protein EOO89_21555 [Pedobacter sp.]
MEKPLEHSRLCGAIQIYSKVLQAQLNTSELSLLFYYGIYNQEAKEYIGRFNLLNSLSIYDLVDPENHKHLYPGIEFKTTRSSMFITIQEENQDFKKTVNTNKQHES